MVKIQAFLMAFFSVVRVKHLIYGVGLMLLCVLGWYSCSSAADARLKRERAADVKANTHYGLRSFESYRLGDRIRIKEVAVAFKSYSQLEIYARGMHRGSYERAQDFAMTQLDRDRACVISKGTVLKVLDVYLYGVKVRFEEEDWLVPFYEIEAAPRLRK